MVSRYHRQTLVPRFGVAGQAALRTAHVVVIGCGGLGSHSANIMTRLGVGTLSIVDFDTVDLTNLHRTAVYTEDDLGKPKAAVLARHLAKANTDVTVHSSLEKVTRDTITPLLTKASVVLDGSDSLSLRHLINEEALRQCIPWVYAGVNGTVGMVMGVVPGVTPCFECVSATLPEPASEVLPVFGLIPQMTAAIQCAEAVKILTGQRPAGLIVYDCLDQQMDTLPLGRNPACPRCGQERPRS
jgi:adenylyltransferase/sulfurtransferase